MTASGKERRSPSSSAAGPTATMRPFSTATPPSRTGAPSTGTTQSAA